MCINKYVVFVVMVIGNVECNPVVNNLNTSLRDFAVPEDNVNSTSVRTLQKEEYARYANSAPIRNPIRFKAISDNELSSSSARVLHHDHNGYGLLDYDDNHYGHGDYHLHDAGYGHHGLLGHHGDHGHHSDHGHGHGHAVLHGHHETHVFHGGDHGHGLGHGHGHGYDHGYGHGYGYGHGHDGKHLVHALAAKTILWPIAGIALLGAAAALVSNPVLLQLGVVSGRRKRRETSEEINDPYSIRKWLTTYPQQIITKTHVDSEKIPEKISSFNNLRAIEILRKEIDIPKYKRETAIDKEDIVRRHRMNRLLNVNKRTVLRKPSQNPVYVNQPDLPRTESDEDKNYIAVPLLSNS